MKKLSRKFILLVVALGIMFMPIGTVKATLQSNLNTHNRKQTNSASGWMTSIRNMEKTGESMGLSETLNNDLTASSESNNIDMHFMKSTEYGAIAILSASGYGNPQILQESEIKSTTGNETGVYFTGDTWEYVAGNITTLSGINSKYYDSYGDYRIGDALGYATSFNPGCAGWHESGSSTWGRWSIYNIARGGVGLFSYSEGALNNGHGAMYQGSWSAHGVAVCGKGL